MVLSHAILLRAWCRQLELSSNTLLSSIAFTFHLRRYISASLSRVLNIRALKRLADAAIAGTTVLIFVLAVARVSALIHGYGAPMSVYSSLPVPVEPPLQPIGVCVAGRARRILLDTSPVAT